MTWTEIPNDLSTLLLSVPPDDPFTPPLWLASLAEHLRRRRQLVFPLDLNRRLHQDCPAEVQAGWDRDTLPEGLVAALEDGPLAGRLAELASSVAGSRVKVVGLSVPPHGTTAACLVARLLRAARGDLILVASGPGAEMPSAGEELEQAGVDYRLISEQETVFSALLEALLEEKELPPTAGVLPARHRPQFPFEPCPPAPLEELPLPTYSDFNLDDYGPSPRGRYLQLRASRGCLASCAACADRPREGDYQTYPPEQFVDHLAELVRRHGVEEVEFRDLVLNGQPDLLGRWCEELAARQLGLIWSGQGTFLPGMTREVLRAMRRAGCISFRLGLDTGSDRLLQAMGKPFDAATAGQVLEDAREEGLNISISLLVGLPGETDDDLRLTADLLQGHASCFNQVDLLATCEALPGSPLTQEPERFEIGLDGEDPQADFSDAAGNTREVRDRRASDLLGVLTELGIPVIQMLDSHSRAGEPSPALETHRAALSGSLGQLNTVEVGPLQATVSPGNRQVHVYIGGTPITAGPGLTVHARVNGKDLDLSMGRWRSWRDEQDTLHLESTLLWVPARLNLHLAVPPEHGLIYEVALWLEEPATVEQVRLELYAAPLLRRYLGPDGWADLAFSDDDDQERVLCPAPAEYILVAEGEDEIHEDRPLLALALHPTDQGMWQLSLARDPHGVHLAVKRPPSAEAGSQPRELEPGPHLLHSGRLDWVTTDGMEKAVAAGTLHGSGDHDDFCLALCPPASLGKAPHGLGQLAAILRGQELTGAVADLNATLRQRLGDPGAALWAETARDAWRSPGRFTEEVWPALEEEARSLLQPLLQANPRALVLLAEANGSPAAMAMTRLARELDPDVKVVVCGPGVYWANEEPDQDTLSAQEDLPTVLLRGDAEESLPGLLYHLAHGKDLLEVPGALVPGEQAWRDGAAPAHVPELDRLPPVDYDGLDLGLYDEFVLPIEASRGCPRNCVTCNLCRMLHPHRVRGPERILHELEHLMGKYAPHALEFVDLALNGDLAHLGEVCDLLLGRKAPPVPWRAQLMVRPDMDRSLVKRMFKSGCRRVILPVDSLSDQVLQAMRKGFDLKQVEEMLENLRWAGIAADLSLMVGFPRETPELFLETLETLERLRPKISRLVRVTTCELEPGTRLRDDPFVFGIDTSPEEYWRDWKGPFGNDAEERARRVEVVWEKAAEWGIS